MIDTFYNLFCPMQSVESRLGTPLPYTPVRTYKRFVPTFKGPLNAFSIQLFCIDERYEMRLIYELKIHFWIAFCSVISLLI